MWGGVWEGVNRYLSQRVSHHSGTPTLHFRVPGFKIWFHSPSQLPTNVHPGRLKYVGPCHPHESPGLSSWPLDLAFPSKPTGGTLSLSLSLSLLPSLPLYLPPPNCNKYLRVIHSPPASPWFTLRPQAVANHLSLVIHTLLCLTSTALHHVPSPREALFPFFPQKRLPVFRSSAQTSAPPGNLPRILSIFHSLLPDGPMAFLPRYPRHDANYHGRYWVAVNLYVGLSFFRQNGLMSQSHALPFHLCISRVQQTA